MLSPRGASKRIYSGYNSITMLQPGWFYQPPIDWEHKNYLLLDYMSKIDKSYAIHKLSPYLLWTEKLVIDMQMFSKNYSDFKGSLRKEMVGFSWENGIQYADIETLKELEEILEIIDHSLPMLQEKIQLGYKLNNRYPQFLY